MLVNAELSQDFSRLNKQFKELVSALVDIVNIPPVRVEVEAVREGNFRGFDSRRCQPVRHGGALRQ